MHKFHVVLANGAEEDHTAATHRVGNAGELVLVTEGMTDAKDPAGILFAPGTWVRSELERRDDRG